MQKDEFRAKLAAFIRENKEINFTLNDVKTYFSGMDLSEDQLSMIMDYAGEKQKEDRLTEEEQAYLEQYGATFGDTREAYAGERKDLLDRYISGDGSVMERLTALYMETIIREAGKYHQSGITMEDLIQDGNMGLLVGLSMASAGSEDPQSIILESIRGELSMAIEQASGFVESDRKVVSRANELNDSLTKLEKDLGRKVYPEEIAADMGISEEQVKEIIRLTGEELEE